MSWRSGHRAFYSEVAFVIISAFAACRARMLDSPRRTGAAGAFHTGNRDHTITTTITACLHFHTCSQARSTLLPPRDFPDHDDSWTRSQGAVTHRGRGCARWDI